MSDSPFVLTSGNVGGHFYRVIHYAGGSHDYDSVLRTINLWCWDSFGERGEVYDGPGIPHRWYYQNSNFWFRDEKDYAWFLLKWK